MLHRILAYCELNIKILLKTKVSFMWSIVMPTIFLVISKNDINRVSDLGFWMSYIVISSFLFGVGLHAMVLRQSGLLKTIFSIRNEPVTFFFGCLVTQIVYCIICLSLFSVFACALFSFSLLSVLGLGMKFIVFLIPVAFLGYNVTLVKFVYAETASTIVNILLFFLLFIMGVKTPINDWNPLVVLTKSIIEGELFYHLLFAVGSILVSLPCIFRFEAASNERR